MASSKRSRGDRTQPEGGVTVSLNLYSGRPDPIWELVPTETETFQELWDRLLPVPAPPDSIEDGSTGYNGITLRIPNGPELRVHSGPATDGGSPGAYVIDEETGRVRLDADRVFEQWLFETIPPAIRADENGLTFARAAAPQRPANTVNGISGAGTVGGLGCAATPPFPHPTNLWRKNRGDNNCYNYANDEHTLGLSAIPGGQSLPDYSSATLRAAAIADKLVPVGTTLPTACAIPPAAHYMAICTCVHPLTLKEDFHCFRLDRSGHWSHKYGKGFVRNADDARTVLADLRTAAWVQRMTLVGFFISKPGVRLIRSS